MEETTNTGFPTTGTTPGLGTSGLSQLEATERSDTLAGGEGGMKEHMGARAREFAYEGRHQAKRFGSMARERAMKQAESRKSLFASQLDNFAGTLEEVSRTLDERGNDSQKELVERGARYVRKASQQLRNRSTDELFDTAQEQLKANPALAIGGAMVLGFLGVHLLRS